MDRWIDRDLATNLHLDIHIHVDVDRLTDTEVDRIRTYVFVDILDTNIVDIDTRTVGGHLGVWNSCPAIEQPIVLLA